MKNNTSKRRYTGIFVCISVVLAVSMTIILIVSNYNNGNIFTPDGKLSSVNKNQVNFPGEEYLQNGKDTDLKKEDKNADDIEEKDKLSDKGKTNDEHIKDTSDNDRTDNVIINPDGKEEIIDGENGDDTSEETPGIGVVEDGKGKPSVIIPGKDGNVVADDNNENPKGDMDNTASPDDSSNNGNNSGNSGTGDNNGNGDSAGDVTNKVLAEPEKNLPSDIWESFFGEGKPDLPEEGIYEPEDKYSLRVSELLDFGMDNSLNQFYLGEEITPWKLLCQVYVYVQDQDGNDVYRIRKISDCFKIENYPAKATENFSATFYYRCNKDEPWHEGVVMNFTSVKRKVLMLDINGESFLNVNSYSDDVYPDDNYQFIVSKYYNKAVSKYLGDVVVNDSTKLDFLLAGWSLSPNGEKLPDRFTFSEDMTGLIYLYPLKIIPLSEDYQAYLKYSNVGGYYTYRQTLCQYTGSDVLEVPEGIDAIEFSDLKTIKKIKIPSSVLGITVRDSKDNNLKLNVLDEYVVDSKNPLYSTIDGMLTNKEKTVIYSIPASRSDVTVSENIQEVNLSQKNENIETIMFDCENPPRINLGEIDTATIIVPDEGYLNYLIEYGTMLDNMVIKAKSGEEQPYTYSQGAVLSHNNTTLFRVCKDVAGLYYVPDPITKIDENAFSMCSSLEGVIFNQNISSISGRCFDNESLERIIFLGKIPAQIDNDTFINITDKIVEVPLDTKNTYISEWSGIDNQTEFEELIIENNTRYFNENGYKYLVQDDGAILLSTPKDIEVFNENSIPGISIKEIGTGSFSNHSKLRIVELSESVKNIGCNAFSNCKYLECVMSYSKDTIKVNTGALNGCSNLRFVIFNALEGNIAEDFQNIINTPYMNYYVFYCPIDGAGYGTSFQMGDIFKKITLNQYGYEVIRQEDGELIAYGRYTDGGSIYVILGATTKIKGNIVLPYGVDDDGNEIYTTEIYPKSFYRCKNPFTIEGMEYIGYINYMAFYESALSGQISLDWIVSIDNTAFSYCDAITQVTLGMYINNLQAYSFTGCTALEKIIFTNGVCTALVTPSYKMRFYFGCEDNASFKVELQGDALYENYIDQWKYYALGYSVFDDLTEEQELEGIKIVRKWLGMDEGEDI